MHVCSATCKSINLHLSISHSYLTDWTYSTNYNYIVHTYTTDSYYAGTDAPVYIKFYDSTGKLLMGERELRSKSHNPFSKGR